MQPQLPKEILLFLYSDAITIVAPQPGIAPKKAPNIGCNFSVQIDLICYHFVVLRKLINANQLWK